MPAENTNPIAKNDGLMPGDPSFAAPVTNSFGLTDVGYNINPIFADIDGDGDLDAFIGERYGNTEFFENTGTASSPSFAAPVTNSFGLTDVGYSSNLTFADIDDDGDLDVFIGDSSGYTEFFENTGTASSPSFAAPVNNPFGLAECRSLQHSYLCGYRWRWRLRCLYRGQLRKYYFSSRIQELPVAPALQRQSPTPLD